jgi:O-antigen/teichoic acid export membrane protein
LGLASKSLGTFLARTAIFLIRFPLGILTARYLGPEGKGLLYLLITSVMICSVLGNFGMGTAAVYFVGKDRSRVAPIVGNILAFTTVITVIIFAVGWPILQYGRPDVYSKFPLWVWLIVALSIPMHLTRTFVAQVLSSLLRIKEINILEVGTTILQLVMFVSLVSVNGNWNSWCHHCLRLFRARNCVWVSLLRFERMWTRLTTRSCAFRY